MHIYSVYIHYIPTNISMVSLMVFSIGFLFQVSPAKSVKNIKCLDKPPQPIKYIYVRIRYIYIVYMIKSCDIEYSRI